ncbi:hypothetical protein NEDG_02061 [Nematocida displodere]|uniref:Uncharacterized protein n=1 Tax=Nematocida displodere TaxID=1805483 RepID=A0A177ELQ9_9MICR|nr:hypothetical protein NEDG_02061 [Nematocida displodere]
MGLSFFSVFQKHIGRELQRTPGAQEAVHQVARFLKSPLVQKVLGPGRFLLQNAREAGEVAGGALALADQALVQGGLSVWSGAASILYWPVAQSVTGMHRGAQFIGRAFTPGKRFQARFQVHPWIQGGCAEPGLLTSQRPQGPLTSQDAAAFASSVIAGSKYEEIARKYSPKVWRDLKAQYGAGELLKVYDVQLTKREHPEVSFQADLYNEATDTIARLDNQWTLHPIEASARGGYQIHKSEARRVW